MTKVHLTEDHGCGSELSYCGKQFNLGTCNSDPAKVTCSTCKKLYQRDVESWAKMFFINYKDFTQINYTWSITSQVEVVFPSNVKAVIRPEFVCVEEKTRGNSTVLRLNKA